MDLSQFPYLASFVSFQTRLPPSNNQPVHNSIPHFEIALRGVELGYRKGFARLPADISQHYTLCETYHFLCVDVLGGQSLKEILKDIRPDKPGAPDPRFWRIQAKVNRCRARDTAYKLVYLMLMGDIKDEVMDGQKIYNAVRYIVSKAESFDFKERRVVRAAFEERFKVSRKQRFRLDELEKEVDAVDELEDAGTGKADSSYH